MIQPSIRYEILASLPAYGPMYIPIDENDEPFYSEGFAVRFYRTDGTDWVANFKKGWTKLKTVVELSGPAHLLVIAAGQCYVINPEETKPLSAFGGDYQTIFTVQDGRHILQSSTGLTIVEPNGNRWHTERISWDGITDLILNENTLTGFAYEPCEDIWVKFSYNIDTKELVGGSFSSVRS